MQHLIQLDTSQLDRWDDVVLNPAVNVVEHLMAGTLPAVKVNHAFWEQQSALQVILGVCLSLLVFTVTSLLDEPEYHKADAFLARTRQQAC